jgi:hypothetical protein
MSRATKKPSVLTLVSLVVLGLIALVIVSAVLWAVPVWLWTFAFGVVGGGVGERRWAQRRRAA